MTQKDADRVYELDVLSFTTPWSYEAILEEVERNPRAHYFVFEANVEGENLIIGYCGMWIIFDEGHITNLAIDPAHRGKGYAKQMLSAFIEEAFALGVRNLTLEVRSGNAPAIHLYEKTGFVSAGVRKGYYLDSGEDAHIMWLNIERGDCN
jgi:ribosomal-protein-alanine N-acetyltransferase